MNRVKLAKSSAITVVICAVTLVGMLAALFLQGIGLLENVDVAGMAEAIHSRRRLNSLC